MKNTAKRQRKMTDFILRYSKGPLKLLQFDTEKIGMESQSIVRQFTEDDNNPSY